MVVGPVTKQIVKQGSKIYDAIKSGRSKTTPVSTPVNKPVKTENEIADEAYELGKEFAERGTRSETGLWEYPEQSITSADTSINVSKLPQGYTKLIKNNTFKKGDVVLDIGGGRFDNAVDTLKEKDVTVKVYDPFNRSLEHNRAVVETVRDGQADKVVSFNTLNVIPEEANRLKVIEQAHNALKENGEAFFTVYGDPKKKAGATVKGYQAHLPLKDYVSSVKEVFGEDSVTSSGGIIKAIKTSNDIPKLAIGGFFKAGKKLIKKKKKPDTLLTNVPVDEEGIPLKNPFASSSPTLIDTTKISNLLKMWQDIGTFGNASFKGSTGRTTDKWADIPVSSEDVAKLSEARDWSKMTDKEKYKEMLWRQKINNKIYDHLTSKPLDKDAEAIPFLKKSPEEDDLSFIDVGVTGGENLGDLSKIGDDSLDKVKDATRRYEAGLDAGELSKGDPRLGEGNVRNLFPRKSSPKSQKNEELTRKEGDTYIPTQEDWIALKGKYNRAHKIDLVAKLRRQGLDEEAIKKTLAKSNLSGLYYPKGQNLYDPLGYYNQYFTWHDAPKPEVLNFKEYKEWFKKNKPKLQEGGTITPFGDTFNYSTTTGLNKRYLEHYHGNVLDNNLQRIDEQGQTNTMLLSTVERDGKHYILPSYDPLTKSQMKTPQDILKLNQEAIDTGLSVGYPSKDIAEKELQKLRTTIIEDRNKLEEELELYGDFDEEGNRRTYFDPRSEEQIEAVKKRKLDEQMEKIKQRGDTSYGLATGGMISAEERDKNKKDLTQSLRFLLGQGVALGFGDEIEAYVRSKLGDKTYEENKSIIKNEMKAFETENPLTAAGLEIAGGLTSAAGIYKTLGKAGLKQMAARGTAAGGIEGGIYGAGAPEVFGTDNRLAGSAIGTGIGAAVGGVGETVVGAIANTLRKNKVANISPTSTRKDILQNIPRDEKTGNYIMYHGDSMQDIKGDARPTNKGLNVPQESFVKNNPVSLAIDVENARTYAGVLTDKTGASGFLYEVSIPKKILDNVFDPFNEKHVAIFKKRINKMLYEGKGEISTDSRNWKQVKDKDAYIQNSYTDPMQLKGPMATSNNNWDILEQPDVVEALKKEGFTGTWQKETGLETYNQIQIFDGSSVDIITENTQKIFRDNQGTYSMASLDSFLENVDTSKQGGVNTITAKEFNQKLKEAKERGEEIIFNGKDVSDLF